jgi:pimeloyl-ACP methyl ester carboxylesterase
MAPDRTARMVQDRFFAPVCHPLSPEAEAWLEKGRPFRIQVDGRAVQGWQWGQGPAVLFVHGWNGQGGHFAPFIAPLLAAGCSVTAFDAPGHGLSDGKTGSYFQFADTVRALLRTGSGTRLKGLVGHSVGGAAVIGALSREETAARTVLIAPALDLKSILYGAFEGFGIPGPVYRGVIAGYERRYGYSFERDNPVRLLPRLKKRLLIVHDRSDDTTPYLESRRAADRSGNIRLHTTEGLGHKRILTDPAVVRLVVDYLTGTVENAAGVREETRAGNTARQVGSRQ